MTAVVSLGAALAVFVLLDGGGRRFVGSGSGFGAGFVGLAAGAIGLGLTGSLVVLLLGPLLVGAGLWVYRSEVARRAEERRARELPLVVDLLARQLTTGVGVGSAIGSLSAEQLKTVRLTEAVALINAGERVSVALAGSEGLVRAALVAVQASGASGGRVIERLADRLRSNAMDGRAAQAQAGQQLASAAVMSLMAPLVSGLYALSDDRAAHFYLHTIWGALVILTSLSLSAISWLWMRRMTRPSML